ncbi:MAG: sensor domain-containing protein [Jatrophihabitantaceae bacterium]
MIQTPRPANSPTDDPTGTPPFLTALFTPRTWSELLYALLGLPIGVAGFVFTVVTLSVSGGLMVTFVGLPLLALTGLGSRWFGFGIRELANVLIRACVPAPAAFQSRAGRLGWIGSSLKDGAAWRARLYLLLKLPMGIAEFVTAVVFYAYGLGALTYAIWRPFLPCNVEDARVCHRGAQLGSHHTLDSVPGIALTTVIGLVVVLLAPWVVRAVVSVDRLLIRALLGPTGSSLRVVERARGMHPSVFYAGLDSAACIEATAVASSRCN